MVNSSIILNIFLMIMYHNHKILLVALVHTQIKQKTLVEKQLEKSLLKRYMYLKIKEISINHVNIDIKILSNNVVIDNISSL